MADSALRRYTELPALIHLLRHRELTLLDPVTWDDKNDSRFLSLYKGKRNLKSVLALCFTEAGETYHHWRVFAPGSGGVCIQFDSAQLKIAVKKVVGLQLKHVEYLTLPRIRKMRPKTNRLPFLKRAAFEPEKEVRMLWGSKKINLNFLQVPIKLASIKRITLSPWIHPSLSPGLATLLRTVRGCSGLEVYRSTLINNDEWAKLGNSAS